MKYLLAIVCFHFVLLLELDAQQLLAKTNIYNEETKSHLRADTTHFDNNPAVEVSNAPGNFRLRVMEKKNSLKRLFTNHFLHEIQLDETNNFFSKDFELANAVIKYRKGKFSFQASIETIFNTDWKESQFLTGSQFKRETSPKEEIYFTPDIPVSIICGFSINF